MTNNAARHYESDDEGTKMALKREWNPPRWFRTGGNYAESAGGNVVLGKGHTGPLRYQLTMSPRASLDMREAFKRHVEAYMTQRAMHRTQRLRYIQPKATRVSRPNVLQQTMQKVPQSQPAVPVYIQRRPPLSARSNYTTTSSTTALQQCMGIQTAPPLHALGLWHYPYVNQTQTLYNAGGGHAKTRAMLDISPHCASCLCGNADAAANLNKHLARQHEQYRWATGAVPLCMTTRANAYYPKQSDAAFPQKRPLKRLLPRPSPSCRENTAFKTNTERSATTIQTKT